VPSIFARGEFIAHWDDDDWYAPARLEYQLGSLLAGRSDITGLETGYILRLPQKDFWMISPELHRRMFVGDVHGGTLVFRRSVWESGARYPPVNLAEDAAMLRQAMARGQRLVKLPNTGLFIYVRHQSNAWKFQIGSHVQPEGWTRSAPPEYLADFFG
jgi:hypothetical protein